MVELAEVMQVADLVEKVVLVAPIMVETTALGVDLETLVLTETLEIVVPAPATVELAEVMLATAAATVVVKGMAPATVELVEVTLATVVVTTAQVATDLKTTGLATSQTSRR